MGEMCTDSESQRTESIVNLTRRDINSRPPADPQPRTGQSLTAALANALGLPTNTTRAVLTLEAGKPPTLEVTMYATDSAGKLIVEQAKDCAAQIASVHFMLRLEPFQEVAP